MAARGGPCARRASCHRGRLLLRTKMVTVAFVVVELSPNPGAISIPCGDKAREVCGTPLAYNVFSSVANEGRGRVLGKRGKAFGNMQTSELPAQK